MVCLKLALGIDAEKTALTHTFHKHYTIFLCAPIPKAMYIVHIYNISLYSVETDCAMRCDKPRKRYQMKERTMLEIKFTCRVNINSLNFVLYIQICILSSCFVSV